MLFATGFRWTSYCINPVDMYRVTMQSLLQNFVDWDTEDVAINLLLNNSNSRYLYSIIFIRNFYTDLEFGNFCLKNKKRCIAGSELMHCRKRTCNALVFISKIR